MDKPVSLRRHLLAHVPGLADSPSRLDTFIDRGRIAARRGDSLAFEYRYTLTLVLEAFAGDRDLLMVLLLAWIADHQPDLLGPNAEPFAFEAELLDADSADVELTLELTERVSVVPRPGGGVDIVHLPDAPPGDSFASVVGALLQRLTLGGETILPV